MGTDGGKVEQLNQEEVGLSLDLFKLICQEKKIPSAITAFKVDEIGIPGHARVLRDILSNVGKSGSYSSEYEGTSLPDEDRERISTRYKQLILWQSKNTIEQTTWEKYFPLKSALTKAKNIRHSTRLRVLVASHTKDWTEANQVVYFYMSEILGPALGFKYDLGDMGVKQPGDYNLLVAWAFKNVETIKQLYLQKSDSAHIDTQLARGNAVSVNISGLKSLVSSLEIGGPTVNPENETVPLPKLGLSKLDIALSPSSSIALDYEARFANLDRSNAIESLKKILPPELGDSLNIARVEGLLRQLNYFSLLNFTLLKDEPGQHEPIKRLDAKLGFGGKLSEMLQAFLEVIDVAEHDDDISVESALTSMRPEWGNLSLKMTLSKLLEEFNTSWQVGYGSGKAIVVKHADADSSSKHSLEVYMSMMTKMAKGEKRLKIDEFLDDIMK